MNKARDNHFVPQWHQRGFFSERDGQLCYLSSRDVVLPGGGAKVVQSKKWHTPTQKFYVKDLYSTFFGVDVSDEIERKLFGPIDDNGSKAIRAFLTDDQSQWHHSFENLFIYLDAQKLRTPKGLEWIRSKYPQLSQSQLMREMQSLRSIHCTLWAEGVRELVSAESSDVKFIVSDHPVTIYNYACPPESLLCKYPHDPDISLKGSQTIFPLDKNRCLILTNLEYANNPEKANPLEQRTNATRIRQSLVNTIEFINTRKLSADEVTKINYVIKNRAHQTVAAGEEDWLYPESQGPFDWADIRDVLLPPPTELFRYGGEIFAQFEGGAVHYQDAFGRTSENNEFLSKSIDEAKIGRNDWCGCGSGRKYKKCCRALSVELRTSWAVASIRERNLAFCNCIRDVLGLDKGKTWLDVRRELSDKQVSDIYGFYSVLWPRETDVYALLPKSDGKFRGLYTGALDVRVIGQHALPVASVFDEFLIQMPIVNPNVVKPDFNPAKVPEKFRYQALKDFLFMLEMEPFIGSGLINLVPDPSQFDLALMRAVMDMAESRSVHERQPCSEDLQLMARLGIEDVLNTTALMPRAQKIQMLRHEFGLSEEDATATVSELESDAESSPLMLLPSGDPPGSAQLISFSIGPNYEMALFLAQVTGSVLVTDSGSRWGELTGAQHRDQGVISYPWSAISDQLNLIPIDDNLPETRQKSLGQFAVFRNLIKAADHMVLANDQDFTRMTRLADEASNLVEQASLLSKPAETVSLKILSPEGGLYDPLVQRLLVQSSCQKYDNKVRSIYGLGLRI